MKEGRISRKDGCQERKKGRKGDEGRVMKKGRKEGYQGRISRNEIKEGWLSRKEERKKGLLKEGW